MLLLFTTSAGAAVQWSITNTHPGSFVQGAQGVYTITITNVGNSSAAGGTVTENPPAGLVVLSLTSSQWQCGLTACQLPAGAAMAPGESAQITVLAIVPYNAPAMITNSATVSGGGAPAVTATDATPVTPINPESPALAVQMSHSAIFQQGFAGAQYTIGVLNEGTGSIPPGTSIQVTDTLPAGLTAASASGTGWQCGVNGSNVICTRSDGLPAENIYSPIALVVNVASNAPGVVANTATVSLVGAGNPVTITDTTVITAVATASPQWSLGKTHAGSFTQGQQNAAYTITVTNTGATAQGNATVTETLPAGLTLVSMSGTGWTCQGSLCSLGAGGQIQPRASSVLSVVVNVAADAPAAVVNQATLSAPGFVPITASDATVVAPMNSPQWSINEMHSGNFTQGQQGATGSIAVTNTGTGPSSSLVAVTANPPSGLTIAGMSGSGWSCLCGTICSRSDALGPGQAYPPITISFNVASNAAAKLTTSVMVSGGSAAAAASAADTITVNQNSPPPAGPPFGSFDTPAASSSGSGSVAFTGWALGPAGIAKVDLWREPNPGELASSNGLMYIGDTALVAGARPDVQAGYPSYPGNEQAGWGYLMLTNFLPSNTGTTAYSNGVFRIHAIAHGQDGLVADLGVKTLTADNAHATVPFGAIDTPSQGGSASGMYANFGWALTPLGKSILTDGSTITVVLDNQPLVGHPVYNQYRSDIATLFPGYANSQGAVGVYSIDTAKLSNGRHSIAWLVSDTAGQSVGIGSRYFTVQNVCQ